MFNWISHVIDFTENNFVAIAFLDFALLTCYELLENPDEGKGSQMIDVQCMIVLTKVANQQNKQHGFVSHVNYMIEYIDSISKKNTHYWGGSRWGTIHIRLTGVLLLNTDFHCI